MHDKSGVKGALSDALFESEWEKSGVGREIDGAYAEYMKLPAENFLKIPEALDWKKNPAEIAVICDAIATPFKVIRHASIKTQDTVAIIGAGGGLGIHMIIMANWEKSKDNS